MNLGPQPRKETANLTRDVSLAVCERQELANYPKGITMHRFLLAFILTVIVLFTLHQAHARPPNWKSANDSLTASERQELANQQRELLRLQQELLWNELAAPAIPR